jgi:hypothetical protein
MEKIQATKPHRWINLQTTKRLGYVEIALECGHTVRRKPSNVRDGQTMIVCEWCECGENPQEVA